MAPEREQSACGHALTLHRPAAAAPVGRAAVRGQRHAVRLREPGRPRLPARAAGARRLRRQPRLQPRRRRDLLRHGLGGDGGHAAAACRRSPSRCSTAAMSPRPGGRRGWWPCACWSRGCRPRRCSTSTCRAKAPRGIRFTRLGHRVYSGKIVEQVDPRGRTHYWLGGGPPQWEALEGTDMGAVHEGFVAVTPVHLDLTNHRALAADGRLGQRARRRSGVRPPRGPAGRAPPSARAPKPRARRR